MDNSEQDALKWGEALLLGAVDRKYPRGVLLRQATLWDQEAFEEWERAVEAHDTEAPTHPHSRRIDGLLLLGEQRTAIEVKVSRSDFRNETNEKTRAWKRHSHRFVYLTPPGLLRPAEVGDAGLWESDGRRVEVVKKAVLRRDVPDFPDSFVRTLIWRAAKAEARAAS